MTRPKCYFIYGLRNGEWIYIFAWLHGAAAGIDRAEREAADHNQSFAEFKAVEIY